MPYFLSLGPGFSPRLAWGPGNLGKEEETAISKVGLAQSGHWRRVWDPGRGAGDGAWK